MVLFLQEDDHLDGLNPRASSIEELNEEGQSRIRLEETLSWIGGHGKTKPDHDRRLALPLGRTPHKRRLLPR
jgi:hypothetical protein